MKLKLPMLCQQLELTDHERVFANFMLNVANLDEHKSWQTTVYQFFRKDLTKIIGTRIWWKTNLNQMFELGQLNKYTGSVRFLISNPRKRYGHVDYYVGSIEDEDAIRIHMYLLGRLSTHVGIMSDAEILEEYPRTVNLFATAELNNRSQH